MLNIIFKNQEINSKEILNIKQTNLKLQQENSKLKTDIEQLKQSEQSFKTVILETEVNKVRMQKQIEKLKQKIKKLTEKLVENDQLIISLHKENSKYKNLRFRHDKKFLKTFIDYKMS